MLTTTQVPSAHSSLVPWCTQQGFLHDRREISDNSTQNFTAYGGEYAQSFSPDDHGTSHLSVVDSEQGAVAMTTTINTGFGSKVVSASTGMLSMQTGSAV